MEQPKQSQVETADLPITRSRKANRRTLKGCITQAERMQQQIRNVGMQYAERNPIVFKALNFQHQLLDEIKNGLDRASNAL